MLQILVSGICSASVVCIVALGFGMIYYVNRTLHIAHGAVYVIAGYASFLCTIHWNLSPVVSAALASLSAIAAGALTEIMIYRPLARKNASGAVILISSLGAYFAFVNIIALSFGNDRKILRPGVERTIELPNLILTHVQVFQVIVALAVLTSLYVFLFWTSYGKVGRAIADNPTLASVLGMNVEKTRLLVMCLGSGLAGLGAFMASLERGVDPNMGFPIVLAAAVACIIGGVGNFLAPAIGAYFVGILESATVWQLSGKWSNAMTFILLIAFLLLRPQGLLGSQRRAVDP